MRFLNELSVIPETIKGKKHDQILLSNTSKSGHSDYQSSCDQILSIWSRKPGTSDFLGSIAQFMAYVHGSVNEMSKVGMNWKICSQKDDQILYKFY